MAYTDIVEMARDSELISRWYACAAEQGKPSPQSWVDQRIWTLASTTGWASPYAAAVAASNPHPGWDATVLTDAMLLSRIQPMS